MIAPLAKADQPLDVCIQLALDTRLISVGLNHRATLRCRGEASGCEPLAFVFFRHLGDV
jgi:hypothetical protein